MHHIRQGIFIFIDGNMVSELFEWRALLRLSLIFISPFVVFCYLLCSLSKSWLGFKIIVLIVVTLLHALYVVNTVILRLFVFAKWVLVMLKPQSFLLLENSALFVIVLATLSTPVIKSMGSLLAANSPIGHPKLIIWLLLTLFLSFFPKE